MALDLVNEESGRSGVIKKFIIIHPVKEAASLRNRNFPFITGNLSRYLFACLINRELPKTRSGILKDSSFFYGEFLYRSE